MTEESTRDKSFDYKEVKNIRLYSKKTANKKREPNGERNFVSFKYDSKKYPEKYPEKKIQSTSSSKTETDTNTNTDTNTDSPPRVKQMHMQKNKDKENKVSKKVFKFEPIAKNSPQPQYPINFDSDVCSDEDIESIFDYLPLLKFLRKVLIQ